MVIDSRKAAVTASPGGYWQLSQMGTVGGVDRRFMPSIVTFSDSLPVSLRCGFTVEPRDSTGDD